MLKKILAAVLCSAVLLSISSAALAGTSISGGGNTASGGGDIYNVPDFTFRYYEHGLGCGSCPVYTAPSTKAYRCANGKASCWTESDLFVGGFEETGWLMIRYNTSDGGVRVGYIPPSYVLSFKADIRLKFVHIPQTATGRIEVTDNPLDPNSAFAVLDPGETYYILGRYTYYGNWWYIECTVDGQVARGFIDRGNTPVSVNGQITANIGNPERSPYGGKRIGTVVINGDPGMTRIVRENAGAEYDLVTRVYGEDEYPAYAMKTGTNGNTWYYIYVNGDWGWISSGVSRLR